MTIDWTVPRLIGGAASWATMAGAAHGIDSIPAVHAGQEVTLAIAGYQVPIVTAAAGVLGVVLARPLAPRGAVPLTRLQSLCVAGICIMLVLAWIIDARPGLLFALVMAVGAGFSGFAIIELAGREVLALAARLLSAINPKGGSDA